MKFSVYVSAEKIMVVGHTGNKIERYASYPLPEGTLYNGTIIDGAYLTESLTSMKIQHPELFLGGVTLVVDGSTILSRRLIAPKLSKKQYLQLVRDDFADSVGDANELICGYRKVDPSDNAILACAVNKAQVDSYISTFTSAGIKLNAIHVGVDTVLSFVKTRPELREGTIVINVVDGFTMLSMLFINGSNVFMSRTRLYGDEKEQVFQNILENLNGLIQFTRSQKFDDISVSYYLGVKESDMRLLEAFNPYTDIRLGVLAVNENHDEVPPEAHFACLSMMFGGQGIDLVEAHKELERFIRAKRPKKLWIPLMAAYVLLLAAAAVYLMTEIDKETGRINEIKAYINSPAIRQTQSDFKILMGEIAHYSDIAWQMERKVEFEKGFPVITGRMMDLIVLNHGVDINVTSFIFDEKTCDVRIVADCADAGISADYVDALYRSGIVKTVNYQGYGSNTNGVFSFAVEIVLDVEGAE